MKLKEFMDNLNYLINERPELLEYQVVFSIDDEGNGFDVVYFQPTIGQYKDSDFVGENNGDEERGEITPNAICIN